MKLTEKRAKELIEKFGVTFLDGEGPTLYPVTTFLELVQDIMRRIRESEDENEQERHMLRLTTFLFDASEAGYDLLLANHLVSNHRFVNAIKGFQLADNKEGARQNRAFIEEAAGIQRDDV